MDLASLNLITACGLFLFCAIPFAAGHAWPYPASQEDRHDRRIIGATLVSVLVLGTIATALMLSPLFDGVEACIESVGGPGVTPVIVPPAWWEVDHGACGIPDYVSIFSLVPTSMLLLPILLASYLVGGLWRLRGTRVGSPADGEETQSATSRFLIGFGAVLALTLGLLSTLDDMPLLTTAPLLLFMVSLPIALVVLRPLWGHGGSPRPRGIVAGALIATMSLLLSRAVAGIVSLGSCVNYGPATIGADGKEYGNHFCPEMSLASFIWVAVGLWLTSMAIYVVGSEARRRDAAGASTDDQGRRGLM